MACLSVTFCWQLLWLGQLFLLFTIRFHLPTFLRYRPQLSLDILSENKSFNNFTGQICPTTQTTTTITTTQYPSTRESHRLCVCVWGGGATKYLKNCEKNEESSSRSSTFGNKFYKETKILEIVAFWVSRAALVKAPVVRVKYPPWGNGFSLNHGWGIYGVRRKITVVG